jgi:hypothetical protein
MTTCSPWCAATTSGSLPPPLLHEAGIPTRTIVDQLGHSRVSITQDHYLGRTKEPGVSTARALDAIVRELSVESAA